MNWQALLSTVGGLTAGSVGTYAAFYLRGALARREQIAKSLAEFYSSAATVYYAAKERENVMAADESGQYGLTLYKLFDQRYKEFLSSSTLLASLVPPALRDEVLNVEDLWDKINDKGFEAVPGKMWFDNLDKLRCTILDSISYSSITDPFWKRAPN
jgi:hypothetical protein